MTTGWVPSGSVAGTESAPVVLDSDASSPARGDWYGVRVVVGAAGQRVALSHCRVEHSKVGLDVRVSTYQTPVSVEHCVVRESEGHGIYLEGKGGAKLALTHVLDFAASTYLELDAAGGFDLSRGGVGPYLKGGLGFLGYLHPTSNRLYGGIGPTVAMGFKIERFDVGVKGTWVPGIFQGEQAHQNLFTAGLSVGIAL